VYQTHTTTAPKAILTHHWHHVVEVFNGYEARLPLYILDKRTALRSAVWSSDEVNFAQVTIGTEHAVQILLVERLGEHAHEQLVFLLWMIFGNSNLQRI
jgi:hypothetical protein